MNMFNIYCINKFSDCSNITGMILPLQILHQPPNWYLVPDLEAQGQTSVSMLMCPSLNLKCFVIKKYKG